MSLENASAYVLLLALGFYVSDQLGIEAVSSSAYCHTPYCGSKNLACRNNGNISHTCAPGSRIINLNTYKEQLLRLFNTFRNKVAAGYTRTLFPAGRMARMDWSTELEHFAEMYIKTCLPDSHPCMASSLFTVIGGIYDGLSYSGNQKLLKIPEILEELLNAWFEDARFVTRQLSMNLTDDFNRPSVRQATLLMADRNSHVGCSALRFGKGMINQFRVACTFATDNMINKPIYKAHAVAGKLCKHRDRIYKNLCAIGEPYNNQHEYKLGEVLPVLSEFLGESIY